MSLLRDFREARDWLRPWRDKPGWHSSGSGAKCCCKTTSSTPSQKVACCANPLPLTLFATFPSSGHCPDLDGQTVQLTFTNQPRLNYNFSAPRWEWIGTNTNSCEVAVQFFCTLDPGFTQCNVGLGGCKQFQFNVPAFGVCTDTSVACTCSPLSVHFKNVQFLPISTLSTCPGCLDGFSPATWTSVVVTQ